MLPPPVLTRLVRQQTATVDFTTSNVRGAPFTLYIAGAQILGNHPIGPLGGTAWNLTTISVDGSLDMGLHLDTGAVDEPELLRTCIESAFAELLPGLTAERRPDRAQAGSGPSPTVASAATGATSADISSNRRSSRRSETSAADTSSRVASWASWPSMTPSDSVMTVSVVCGTRPTLPPTRPAPTRTPGSNAVAPARRTVRRGCP